MKRLLGPGALALALLAHLAPIWLLPIFPTQDAPAHVATAHTLDELARPGSLERELFVARSSLATNGFAAALLRPLLSVVTPAVAEKLFLSAFVLALPLLFLWTLARFGATARWPVFLVLPFTHAFVLHLGFLNFLLGTLVFLLVLVQGWRCAVRPTLPGWLALSALLVLAHLAHPFPAVLAAGAAGTLLLVERLRGRRGLLLPFALCLVPMLLLVVRFLGHHALEPGYYVSIRHGLRGIGLLSALCAYRSETVPAVLLNALFLALLVLGLRRRLGPRRRGPGGPEAGLLAFVGLCVAALFFGPADLGIAGYLIGRTIPLAYLVLALWIGLALPRPPLGPVPWAAAALLLGLAALLLRVEPQRAFVRDLEEYGTAAARIQPGSLALALHTNPRRLGDRWSARADVCSNALERASVTGGFVSLANYQAAVGYFPIAYRPDRDPRVHLAPEGGGARIRLPPFRASFERFRRETGLAVDYVLVFGPPADELDAAARASEEAALAGVRAELERDYEPVFVSERGMARLFRRRAGR